jgi:hypothetical protein
VTALFANNLPLTVSSGPVIQSSSSTSTIGASVITQASIDVLSSSILALNASIQALKNEVPSYTNLTQPNGGLISPWNWYLPLVNVPRYYVSRGRVFLEGSIFGGTVGTAAVQMPSALRPMTMHGFVVLAGGGITTMATDAYILVSLDRWQA